MHLLSGTMLGRIIEEQKFGTHLVSYDIAKINNFDVHSKLKDAAIKTGNWFDEASAAVGLDSKILLLPNTCLITIGDNSKYVYDKFIDIIRDVENENKVKITLNRCVVVKFEMWSLIVSQERNASAFSLFS